MNAETRTMHTASMLERGSFPVALDVIIKNFFWVNKNGSLIERQFGHESSEIYVIFKNEKNSASGAIDEIKPL